MEIASEMEFSTYGSHHQLLPQPGEMNVAFLFLTDFITISEIKNPQSFYQKDSIWSLLNVFTFFYLHFKVDLLEKKNATFYVKRLSDSNINDLVFGFSYGKESQKLWGRDLSDHFVQDSAQAEYAQMKFLPSLCGQPTPMSENHQAG